MPRTLTTDDLDYLNSEYFLVRKQTKILLVWLFGIAGLIVTPAAAFTAAFAAAKLAINNGAAAIATNEIEKMRQTAKTDCDKIRDSLDQLTLPIVTTGAVRAGNFQTGSPSVTTNAGTRTGETNVKFDPTPFTKPPQVVVTPRVSDYIANYAVSIYNVSNKGFSVCTVDMANHPTNIDFDFVAIQPK
ncbi:MAG TPA: H-type lectin domain-containing protein [Pirellulales bacterium]|jgi:hypothetical protein|nr:H-type lectin domain-containing protein [Pirellulales bacterium]